MAENIFASFDISGQGMSVQRMRLSATADNIANINTTKGPDGLPYQRKVVVVRAVPNSQFDQELNKQILIARDSGNQISNAYPNNWPPDYRVLKAKTARDNTLPRLVYDPGHPDADKNGYVKYPNINIVTEMVNMISAQRAFQANVGVVDAAKNIARDSLDI